jgi:uncharacterized protein YggE
MKTGFCLIATLSLLFAAPAVPAQGIQVNPQNRTVAVTSSGTVEADSEIAIIHLGCHNYGKTRDAAYSDNTRAASKITGALLAAGVPKTNIETQDVSLTQPDWQGENTTPEERQEKQYEASQSWSISVPPPQAQAVIDRAVAAGANDIDGVAWNVADPDALDAKAAASGLAKARVLAEQMAQQFGGKVGELLFVSNTEPGTIDWFGNQSFLAQQFVTVDAARKTSLQLFPQKVRREVKVYAVFALQ